MDVSESREVEEINILGGLGEMDVPVSREVERINTSGGFGEMNAPESRGGRDKYIRRV